MTRLLPILLLLCSVFLYVSPNEAVTHTSGKFVDGFQGIPWGTSLDQRTQVTLIDTKIGRASVGKECRSRWSPYH